MKNKGIFFVLACVVGFAALAADVSRKGIRIAHIADPQLGFITSKIASRSQANYAYNYAQDLAHVEAMIPLVNAEKPDLVFIAGDLMQNAEDVGTEWPELLEKFEAPVLIAPGNHDMGNNVTAANLERFRNLVGYAWTSRSLNGYRVIVMNSQFWYATDGSTTASNAKAEHDAWLTAEIAAAVTAGEKVVLCSHIPPFENTVDEADSYFNAPKSIRTAFMDELIANGVDYWLCGHTHTKTQHQYANANGTLNIWTAEAVCENFDGTPPGFHIFEIPEGEVTATWKAVPIELSGGNDDPVKSSSTDDYVWLDYISASGTQWIDTHYKVNPKSQIYFKFAADDLELSIPLFGCGTTSSDSRLRVMRRKAADAIKDGVCFIDMGGENANAPTANPDSEIHEIFVSNTRKTYDGLECSPVTKSLTTTIDKSLYLMGYNNISTSNPFVGRLYACQILEENELKMNLVPAMHKASGVAGLYDLCSGDFLTNGGTGTFGFPCAVNVKCRGGNIVISGITDASSKSICLCWGPDDCGKFGWTNAVTLAEKPLAGRFEYIRKASDLGIKKGDFVRAFVGDLKEVTIVDSVKIGVNTYFDLGVGADPTTVMSLHGKMTTIPSDARYMAGFGVMNHSSDSLSFAIYTNTKQEFAALMNDGKSQVSRSTGLPADKGDHLFVLDAVNHCYTIDGGDPLITYDVPTLSTLGSIYLGALHRVGDGGGALAQMSNLEIYSFTLTKGGTEVMHLIPAKDGNEACLFDSVTGTVFKKASGTVTASSTEKGAFYGVGNVRATASNTYTPPQGLVILLGCVKR